MNKYKEAEFLKKIRIMEERAQGYCDYNEPTMVFEAMIKVLQSPKLIEKLENLGINQHLTKWFEMNERNFSIAGTKDGDDSKARQAYEEIKKELLKRQKARVKEIETPRANKCQCQEGRKKQC